MYQRLHIDPTQEETIDATIAIDEQGKYDPSGKTIIAPTTLSMAGSPSTWTMRPAPPRFDPRSPEYTRAPEGSALADAPVVDAVLDGMRRFRDDLVNMVSTDDGPDLLDGRWNEQKVIIGELDIAQKLSVQHGRAWDTHLSRLGNPDPVEVPDGWRRMAARVAVWWAEVADAASVASFLRQPDPADTNSGYPLFTPGPIPKLISLSMLTRAAPTLTEFQDGARGMANHWGLHPSGSLAFGLSHRAGPAHKAKTLWEDGPSRGSFRATKAIKGGFPRARDVFMAPYVANVVLRPLWAHMIAAMKAIPGLRHTGTEDDDIIGLAYAAGMHCFESDISGFDQNVRSSVQDAAGEGLKVGFPHLSDVIDIWRDMERRPVITNSWLTRIYELESGVAREARSRGYTVVGAYGGTHSGLKPTSTIGTYICLTTTLYALERMGVVPDAIAALRRGEIKLLCLGDDVLLAVDRPLDRHAWRDAWASVGLTCEISAACRFLMQHRTPDGPRRVLSRVLQNAAFPEYQDISDHARAIAALGWSARLDLPTFDGLPEAGAVEAIKHLRWIRDPPGLPTGIRPESLADVTNLAKGWYAPYIQQAMAHLASSSELERLKRDAEHSPGAAAQLQYILQFAPELLEATSGNDGELQRLTLAILAMSERERLNATGRLEGLLGPRGLKDTTISGQLALARATLGL